MSKVTWVPEISLGHVITLTTTVVAMATAWQSMTSTIESHANKIGGIETRLEKQERDLITIKDLAAKDRLDQTAILTELRTDLRYLRQAIERQGEGK